MHVLGEGLPPMHREVFPHAFLQNPGDISVKALWDCTYSLNYKLLESKYNIFWYITQCHIVLKTFVKGMCKLKQLQFVLSQQSTM